MASSDRQQPAVVEFRTTDAEKETPTENFDDIVFGFYALNGNSVVACKEDLSKESVGNFSHRIREKNPERPILIVWDNFSSHFAEYVDTVVNKLDLHRVALPWYSPDLNPIEQI